MGIGNRSPALPRLLPMNLPLPVAPRAVETLRPSLPEVIDRVNAYAAQLSYRRIDPAGTSIVGASMAEVIADRLIETRGVHNTELAGRQPGSGLPPQPGPLNQIAIPAARGAGDELHLQFEVPGSFAHQPCPCGTGYVICSCGGTGRTYCSPTRPGANGPETCFSCGGTGSQTCSSCGGVGRLAHGRCGVTGWLSTFGLAEIKRETVRETYYLQTPASPTAKQIVGWPRHEQRITAGLHVPAEIEEQLDEVLRSQPGERYIDGRVRILPMTALKDVEGKTVAIINDTSDRILFSPELHRRRIAAIALTAAGIALLVLYFFFVLRG